MVCSYCGLPTDGGQNHGTTEQCIHALALEAQRLRGERLPRQAVASPPGGPDVVEALTPQDQPESQGG
jgi:hypothetical protein